MFHKAFIDPRSTINYSSYYIQGLYDVLGKSNVHFSSRYFSGLKEIDTLMAFVLVGKEITKKIIIDYRDQSDMIEEAFSWSDVYAKINVDAQTMQHPASCKLINIPPSFAIKIWNPAKLFYHLCDNFIKAKIFKNFKDKNIHIRPKRWIWNYLCMGKAIISTPLINMFPVPVEHGEHIYFVNNKQEIEKAVAFLLENKDVRQHLERNAKLYYDKYASPVKVIEHIVQHVAN